MNAIPPGANEEAKEFKIGANAVDEVKQALVEDGSVLAGFYL